MCATSTTHTVSTQNGGETRYKCIRTPDDRQYEAKSQRIRLSGTVIRLPPINWDGIRRGGNVLGMYIPDHSAAWHCSMTLKKREPCYYYSRYYSISFKRIIIRIRKQNASVQDLWRDGEGLRVRILVWYASSHCGESPICHELGRVWIYLHARHEVR